MKIFIEKENKVKDIKFQGRLSDLLKKLKINPQTVIITRNKKLITLDTQLNQGDKIEILSVVSGG